MDYDDGSLDCTLSASLHSLPATSESSMPPKKKIVPQDGEAPRLIPLYLLNISNQLTKPLPPTDSEEWYSLAADVEIAIDRNDFTQSLSLFPPDLHPKLNDLKDVFESWERPEEPDLNPYRNLQHYAAKARLPPMPWSPDMGEESDHETLLLDGVDRLQRRTGTHTVGSSTVVSPDSARKLRNVRRIPTHQLFQRVLAYSKSHLPSSQCTDPLTKKPILSDPRKSVDIGITVPHYEHKVSETGRPAPDSESQIQQNWVMNIVCKTAQRILHVYDDACQDWQYRIIRGKGSQQKLADYVWSKSAEGRGARMVLEVKTPWTFLPSDFQEFVEMENGIPLMEDLVERANLKQSPATDNLSTKSGRTRTTKRSKPSFTKAENLMAQVYDYCVRQGHHWFIATTYERWVFGVFSLDYSSAEVTEVLEYNCAQPTILECVLFWTQSAMYVPGLWEIPRFIKDTTSIRPYIWRDATNHWSSHGFLELEAAILQRQIAWGTVSYSRHEETFVKAIWNTLHPRWKSTRSDLNKDLKGKAILGAQKVFNLITSTDHIDWSIRLTWLALLQYPTRLFPELACFTEFYVRHSWTLKHDVAVHPIQKERLTHPLLDDKRFRQLDATVLQAICDPTRTSPNLFQDQYDPRRIPEPQTEFLQAIENLVSREIFIVLTKFLPPEITDVLRQALISDGILRPSRPTGISYPAQHPDNATSSKSPNTSALGLEDTISWDPLEIPRTPGLPSDDEQSPEYDPFSSWNPPPTPPSPVFARLFDASSHGASSVELSLRTLEAGTVGLGRDRIGGLSLALATQGLRVDDPPIPDLPTPQPTPARQESRELTDMDISGDEPNPEGSIRCEAVEDVTHLEARPDVEHLPCAKRRAGSNALIPDEGTVDSSMWIGMDPLSPSPHAFPTPSTQQHSIQERDMANVEIQSYPVPTTSRRTSSRNLRRSSQNTIRTTPLNTSSEPMQQQRPFKFSADGRRQQSARKRCRVADSSEELDNNGSTPSTSNQSLPKRKKETKIITKPSKLNASQQV